MQDVMVDLETLGNTAGCVILSIGAVGFDPKTGQLGETFYEVISMDDAIRHGLLVDNETVAWWNKQSEEARQVLREAKEGGLPLDDALHAFNRFLRGFGKGVRLWGNGSDFDNAILAFAYKITGIPGAWAFWDNRCYRTLKSLKPSIKLVNRQGTYHNALDDAITQARHALEMFGHKGAQTVVEAAPVEEEDLIG